MTGSDEFGRRTGRAPSPAHRRQEAADDRRRRRTRLDTRCSDATAPATPWPEAEALFRVAELFRISTVRPDGRPHATPLPAVRSGGGALHFRTGPEEREGRDLAGNAQAVPTTGTGTWGGGCFLAAGGEAVRVTDEGRLREPAAREARYGEFWHFEVRNGRFPHRPGHACVFSVAPRTDFRFGEGEPFSQTRRRFDLEEH